MPTEPRRQLQPVLPPPADAMLQPFVDLQRTLFDEWMRGADQALHVVLQFQRAGLEASLRLVEATGEANRQVFNTWLSTAEQTQRSLRQSGSDWQAEREHERDRERAERQPDQEPGERQQAEREQARAQRQPVSTGSTEPPAINVVKRDDDWAVVRENASRATAVFDTKREAVERARELAKRDDAEVHIGTAAEAARAANQGAGRAHEDKPTTQQHQASGSRNSNH